MVRRGADIVAVVALSVGLFAFTVAPFVGLAGANVSGEPELSLAVADNRLSAGETATLEVAVSNRAELDRASNTGNVERERRVTTARGVTVSPSSDGPVTVRTSRASLGSIPDGEVRTAAVEVVVDSDADPGTYEVPVEVEYKYTEWASERETNAQRSKTRTESRTIDVVVDEEARFEVVDVESRPPGEDGSIAVAVENTGEAMANDAVASLSSRSGDLQFGEAEAGRTFVDEWAPGERRILRFRGAFHEDAALAALPATLSVEYTDDDGVAFTSESAFGIAPADDQQFDFEVVDATLRVAEEGSIVGTVVNEGPRQAENVVVSLSPPGQNVEVLEPEVAVGDLEPGEAVDVTFDVEVSSDARAGPRQFAIDVDYESSDGTERSADTIRFREEVQPRRDVFTVEPTGANVTAGDTERVVLAVTNNRDEPVTDVSAKLFASRPLSVDDDEAFVGELAPNETVELPFRVSASDRAMAKDYPLSVDFQYVDETGETRLSDTYRVPVSVEESDDGFLSRLFELLGLHTAPAASSAGAAASAAHFALGGLLWGLLVPLVPRARHLERLLRRRQR